PPLIHKVFPITDAVAAFRYMAASKHVGKVVLDMGNIRNEQIKRGIICSDATYVVTGGLGALGLELCSWLVEMGARHIALAGRREAGLEAREKISRLQGQGVSVMAVSADASVLEDVERLFSAIGGAMPPVRGVFHAAGVLEDSVILNQDAERFRRVMGPKVCGTWNLYNIIKNTDIDFLVLFSSASSVLGSAGQANYAGANAFLDSAAYYISGCGIRTIAIEWGPWAGAGMAAGRPESTLKTEKSGFNKIEIKD
ncbi:MAG: SDR family NAD(P)-dependent oxidoreductase, partial [Nitrospirae bacterium]|nr:SDR family NAD(P)-dependent oxidoreductase [Nitrospirota bacterium]